MSLLLGAGALLHQQSGGGGGPSNPWGFGSELVVYIDAEDITGIDGDAISSVTNNGSGPNFNAPGTAGHKPTLKIVGGDKIIRFDGNNGEDRLSSATSIAAMSAWTFYAVVKTFATDTDYLLAAGDANHAIIKDFVSGSWEYYDTPRTVIDSVDNANFIMLKCTVGTTAAGTWFIGSAPDTFNNCQVDLKVLIAVDRALTGPEETDVEADLALRL
jgi:hypothetical protein